MLRVEHNRPDNGLISQMQIAMCKSASRRITAQCQRLSCSFHSGDIIVRPAPVSVFRRVKSLVNGVTRPNGDHSPKIVALPVGVGQLDSSDYTGCTPISLFDIWSVLPRVQSSNIWEQR